jgi:hypothetical protein
MLGDEDALTAGEGAFRYDPPEQEVGKLLAEEIKAVKLADPLLITPGMNSPAG